MGAIPQDRGQMIVGYVAAASNRNFPKQIVEAAKVALVDHIACSVGAYNENGARATRRVAEQWSAPGKARIFNGPTTSGAMAALVNGTAAHCFDFDDTHIDGAGHISAACWSASLAVGADRDLDEKTTLTGFITGFEVMARLGARGLDGVGRAMQKRGIHPSGVLGSVGAAAAVAAMMRFDEPTIKNALGLAATSGSGLVASFGTDSKPYHCGKAAMDGILSVDLAAAGFHAAHHLFERDGGLLDAFVQDRKAQIEDLDFTDWELERNGYKPFASCRSTHASIQAAHSVTDKVAGRPVRRIVAKVHPNGPVTAGKPAPKTPLEAKFSIQFCVAMALHGYKGIATDFVDDTLRDSRVQQIVPNVELVPVAGQPQYESYLDIWLEDGEHLRAETKHFLGHPLNPMSTDDMHAKFISLVEPIFGASRSVELFDTLMQFDRPGSLKRVVDLTAPN